MFLTAPHVVLVLLGELCGEDVFWTEQVVVLKHEGVDVHVQLEAPSTVSCSLDEVHVKVTHCRLQEKDVTERDGFSRFRKGRMCH